MSWITTKYEEAAKAYFIKEFGQEHGCGLYSDYEHIRNELVSDNFFTEIKINAPNLSDHSDKHIQDVQDRTIRLIVNFEESCLSGMDVYCLSLMILFHDVGNIYGRDGHDSIAKISEVYNKYRTNHEIHGDERRQVVFGASAHSGKSSKGCKDTLKYLTEGSIKNEKINLPEIAAILRFADELSEGKHRTCSFLRDKDMYDETSKIFHKYASITEILVDRAIGRIAITYSINITNEFDEVEQKEIKELIKFTLYRAIKLDQERRYTKYYSSTLQSFKYVTVSYNFEKDYIPLDLIIPPIRLEDQYPVPGAGFIEDFQTSEDWLHNTDSNLNIEEIINTLRDTKS